MIGINLFTTLYLYKKLLGSLFFFWEESQDKSSPKVASSATLREKAGAQESSPKAASPLQGESLTHRGEAAFEESERRLLSLT